MLKWAGQGTNLRPWGEVARHTAILEAIDRDLDELGLVGKAGKPSYVLDMRLRVSRHLDHWLAKPAPELERQRTAEAALSDAGREDYLRELKLIAFGHDPDARPADRVKALELLRLEDQALTTTARQREPHLTLSEIEARIAAMDEAELRRAESSEEAAARPVSTPPYHRSARPEGEGKQGHIGRAAGLRVKRKQERDAFHDPQRRVLLRERP